MIYNSWDKFGNANTGQPRVIRVRLCALSEYFTPFCDSERTLATGEKVYSDKFAIVGTNYGFLHNCMGERRLWSSYSGAYKFLKSNF